MPNTIEDLTIDQNYLREVREHIHRHPELGFDVENTADFIAGKLQTLGLTIKRNIGKTGLIADLIVNPDYPMIALRADMDALPIHEQNTCDYKSTIDGKAHMCGHDVFYPKVSIQFFKNSYSYTCHATCNVFCT
ncbi:hypothetical protein NYP54_03425 [Cysteiniphilum sp. QT6929]|nr:M20/M25/M40 family metallo-hydrolase [Cysteiniphilum sp. QT6929]WHN66293.1 hypothetical protein NYP54_03425 [Cysteiniphilum sp. QT6929]